MPVRIPSSTILLRKTTFFCVVDQKKKIKQTTLDQFSHKKIVEEELEEGDMSEVEHIARESKVKIQQMMTSDFFSFFAREKTAKGNKMLEKKNPHWNCRFPKRSESVIQKPGTNV
ncbi:hypothetical protein E2C01_034647 [Portunus trituberculatus]|uniref:Uncharacterized protein n=1 Tax=Portunus trituberculatus TaxID=210409 RepID=A0A5B7F6V6_PORTR|nr:hypothetical protein [Portunus trituberculatus]